MDSMINTIIEKLFEFGIPEEAFLISLFLLFIYSMIQRFFKPIREKIDQVPTEEYHKQVELVNENDKKILYDRLISIEDNISRLQEYITRNDYNSNILIKETDKINQELQQIRSIVSQFHGHMIYGRSDSFGNREIK